MPPRRSRLAIPLDARTSDLTSEALYCRSWGHRWTFTPVGGRRRAQLRQVGEVEVIGMCANCDAQKTLTIDMDSWDLKRARIDYPEGYLFQARGSGRLPRNAARAAHFVRLGVV